MTEKNNKQDSKPTEEDIYKAIESEDILYLYPDIAKDVCKFTNPLSLKKYIDMIEKTAEYSNLSVDEKHPIFFDMLDCNSILQNTFALACRAIEINLRAQLALVLSKYGKKAYEEKANFDKKRCSELTNFTRQKRTRWQYFNNKLKYTRKKEINGETISEQFYIKAVDGKNLEYIIEYVDFTHHVNLFEMLKQEDKQKIAKVFNYDDEGVFETHLNIINKVRNMVSHHHWNAFSKDDCEVLDKLSPRKNKKNSLPLYGVLSIIKNMSQGRENLAWKIQLRGFVIGAEHNPDDFEDINTILQKHFGFVENWVDAVFEDDKETPKREIPKQVVFEGKIMSLKNELSSAKLSEEDLSKLLDSYCDEMIEIVERYRKKIKKSPTQ